MRSIPWESIITKLRQFLKDEQLPSVSEVAHKNRDAFHILISTMISLRTRDEVTSAASERLLGQAPTPEKLFRLQEEEIAGLIYPAGFYKTKARNLKRTAGRLITSHNSKVPNTMAELLSLPGVGRKTANLVRNLGFGLNGVCVDTHVHRISNRLGWVSTKTPEKTEQDLMTILPKQHWISINEILVTFGQNICSPVSPKCSLCPIYEHCLQVGVRRSR